MYIDPVCLSIISFYQVISILCYAYVDKSILIRLYILDLRYSFL